MTLEEFVIFENRMIEEFELMWRMCNEHTPSLYPGVMELADWEEHMQTYVGRA